MDWTSVISVAAAVASASAAVAAVWLSSRTFRRSAELQAFLALTERYERIMDALPASARASDSWDPDVDADLVLRLRYLNLCSEEFYLMQRRLISSVVWDIWEEEMRSTLASPPYVEAWPALADQFDSYPEFTSFVQVSQS